MNPGANNWSESTLASLGDLARGKSKHRPRNDPKLFGGEYPFIQTSDIKNANFYVNSYSETYNEAGLAQSKLWTKDTLCVTIAANIAESALLSFPSCFPDSVVGFIENPEKSDVRFVKYALDYYKKRYQQRSQGAAQDNLSLEKIESLKLKVPPVPVQKKIADIIFAYDDFIENNEKRIKILEEMAQRLYTEWFVKFKFPEYEKVKMADSPLGKIPEGWKAKKFGDLVQVKHGTTITKEKVAKGSIPVVAAGIEPAYFHNRSNVEGPVITVSASGANAGYLNIYYSDIWASDCSYINKDATPYFFYCYLFLKSKRQQIENLKRGSAQPHVYPNELMNMKVTAAEGIVKRIEEKVEPIFGLIGNLKQQISNLSKTRDLLIPQLVTGRRELKS